MVGDGIEYVARQGPREVPANQVELLTGRLATVHEIGAPGQIDGGLCERFVHRNQSRTVARNARLIAEGLLERLPENDRGVFDRVVHIDVNVTAGAHLKVNE